LLSAIFYLLFDIISQAMSMTEGNLYLKNKKTVIKIQRFSAISVMLLCGLLFFNQSSFARPVDNAPAFVSGSRQALTMCEDAPAFSINSQMAITDADPGQTETWSVVSGPLFGSLGGFSTSATSTGGTITPSGLTYTPMAGYSGNDSFTIQISDGILVATTTVVVTINPTPTLTTSLTPSACSNTAFNYIPASTVSGTIFTWNRSVVAGISNVAASGSGSISETLFNITTSPVAVTYVYALLASGCVNVENVTVQVNPLPLLSSTLTPPAICDSTALVYTPASPVAGTTYNWSRAMVTGISNAAASGSGSVSETLVNTVTSPVAVVYSYTLTANGCSNAQNVTVDVNPLPLLSSTLTPPAICDSTSFVYSPSSLVTGTTFTWSRGTTTGIANSSATGIDNINETLIDTTAFPVVASYVYTLTANGCSNAETVNVTVNALPMLTSTLTPPSICDGAVFNYVPTSLSPGATFDWTRVFTGGISNPAASGTGNPFETLVSVSYDVVPVTYSYAISANGCTNIEMVVVDVKPTPRLSSALADTICSGATFMYSPASLTTGTTYTWSRPAVTGLSPATSSGTGGINEMLSNSSSSAVNASYNYTLAAYGCTSSKSVVLTVNPQIVITTITTEPASSICSGTLYQNFGAGIAPPAGVTYTWSAVNADIYSVGANNQFTLVNFPNGGTASVILTTRIDSTGCLSADTFSVNVNAVGYTAAQVLYYNYQFVYLDNKIDSYQWGYDDASTLDSISIPGASFQSYPNNNPDFVDNYYWVITSKDGCSQKTYYNQPPATTAVKNVSVDDLGIKVYPNPASSVVSIELSGNSGNSIDVTVTDMLGQTIKTQSGTARTFQFSMADVPAGCYLVCCSRNGVKMATAKIIKY
jgi:type IX secretion system substrate protein/Big-like domain-containing protein/PKD domain-containing protein